MNEFIELKRFLIKYFIFSIKRYFLLTFTIEMIQI